jgi:hypothetical protein
LLAADLTLYGAQLFQLYLNSLVLSTLSSYFQS